MVYDRKFDAALEAAAGEAGLGPEEELGMGGGFDPGTGADEISPEEEFPPDEAAAEEPEEEVETAFLTPPAKRDDDWYKLKRKDIMGRPSTTTSKSKGKWYSPVATDKRDMGARKRNYRSKHSYEKGKNTKRNVFKGFPNLLSLSKGIYEETDTNYSSEEKKLFDVNREIENLIVELESKDNEIKTQQKA